MVPSARAPPSHPARSADPSQPRTSHCGKSDIASVAANDPHFSCCRTAARVGADSSHLKTQPGCADRRRQRAADRCKVLLGGIMEGCETCPNNAFEKSVAWYEKAKLSILIVLSAVEHVASKSIKGFERCLNHSGRAGALKAPTKIRVFRRVRFVCAAI